MDFCKELSAFQASHPFQTAVIRDSTFHYLLCGRQDCPYTLVYFVGGTGNPLSWYRHVSAMEDRYRILLVDYPMEQMEPLVKAIGDLISSLGIQKCVWIGASLGGFIAQLMARNYPKETHALVLYAATALTEKGIRELKTQYRSLGKLLWLMEHVPYGLLKALTLKPMLNRMIPKNDPEHARYLKGFADWIYRDYTKEKDLRMTRLMADTVNVHPVSRKNFEYLTGERVLLIHPLMDQAFTDEMQLELLSLFPQVRHETSTGGHLDTLCRADHYSAITRDFLSSLPVR